MMKTNINTIRNSVVVVSSVFYLMFLSGCATQMLHEKINGPTNKEYPTVIKNIFVFNNIVHAQLDTSEIPYVLYLCVTATIESGNQENKSSDSLTEYFITIPVTNDNLYNNLTVNNFTIGCGNRFNSDSNRIAVNMSEISIPAYVPSPIDNHAAKFSLEKIVSAGLAGTILPSNDVFPSVKLQYMINDPLVGGISRYNISVRTKNTLIPVKEKSTEFSSTDLLAVFYPFTIVWDAITTPFIYLYLYVNNIH